MADISKIGATQDCILKSIIEFGSKLCLIQPIEVEAVVFNLSESVDQPFLEEAARVVDGRKDVVTRICK